MKQFPLRIDNVERDVRELWTDTSEVGTEVQKVEEGIDKQASFRMNIVHEQAVKLLSDGRCSSLLNTEVLSLFVSSIGSHITSLFVK